MELKGNKEKLVLRHGQITYFIFLSLNISNNNVPFECNAGSS